MKKTMVLFAVVTLAFFAGCLKAQETGQTSNSPHHYKLNLVVEQINDAGKIANNRAFVVVIGNGPAGGYPQSIRTGEKIPIATGANQFTYLDIGVNFDIRHVSENGGGVSFELSADVSSVADSGQSPANTSPGQPVIRQDKWDAIVLVPIDKPTVVFSADDLRDKGKMQVEVTATRLD